MYHFYILYSKTKDRFYVGHTNDLKERLIKHNSDHKGFTGKTGDWRIMYSEEYTTKSEAYFRERQVKAWKNRNTIKKLISRDKK